MGLCHQDRAVQQTLIETALLTETAEDQELADTGRALGLGRESRFKLDLSSPEQGAKSNNMKHDQAKVKSGTEAPKPSGQAPDGVKRFSPTISSV